MCGSASKPGGIWGAVFTIYVAIVGCCPSNPGFWISGIIQPLLSGSEKSSLEHHVISAVQKESCSNLLGTAQLKKPKQLGKPLKMCLGLCPNFLRLPLTHIFWAGSQTPRFYQFHNRLCRDVFLDHKSHETSYKNIVGFVGFNIYPPEKQLLLVPSWLSPLETIWYEFL